MRKHYTFKELDLYHKDVFIPEELSQFLFPLHTEHTPRYLRLSYSTVARQRAEKDGAPQLDWVTLKPGNVIEIGQAPPNAEGYFPSDITPGNIDTIVVREPFSMDKDILLSISVDFQTGTGYVKMAWTHTPGRPHFSVSKNQYVTKPLPAFNPVVIESWSGRVVTSVGEAV